jgi:hypothetical protein
MPSITAARWKRLLGRPRGQSKPSRTGRLTAVSMSHIGPGTLDASTDRSLALAHLTPQFVIEAVQRLRQAGADRFLKYVKSIPVSRTPQNCGRVPSETARGFKWSDLTLGASAVDCAISLLLKAYATRWTRLLARRPDEAGDLLLHVGDGGNGDDRQPIRQPATKERVDEERYEQEADPVAPCKHKEQSEQRRSNDGEDHRYPDRPD